MKPRALAAFLAVAALVATPSFAVQTNADKCGEPAACGSGAVIPGAQGWAVTWSSSGVDPAVDRAEAVPGAPDHSVFVLHHR